VHEADFILDTGSTFTIIDPSIADILGYSAHDASRFSTVASAAGRERGYRLTINAFEALGQHIKNMEIACHDLKQQGVEGLIGMDVLECFDWCMHPTLQTISVVSD
jgi:predicted aspartyl protease